MLMCFPSRIEPVEDVQDRVRQKVNQLFTLICINGHVEVRRLKVDRPSL